MNVEAIKAQLKSLRLSAAARGLDDVLIRHKKAVNLDWFTELLQHEIDARRDNAQRLRFKQAGFPASAAIEHFDFHFNPEIDEAQIRELARLKFIDEHSIALFLGPPGVGKTHIALAIGTAAAHRGHRVFFSSAKSLIEQIALAKLDNTLDQLFKRILACKLWIIDDFGVVSMKRDIAEEVFDLLDRRKYSSALILTSNRDPAEWGEVFPNAILANATIDRLYPRSSREFMCSMRQLHRSTPSPSDRSCDSFAQYPGAARHSSLRIGCRRSARRSDCGARERYRRRAGDTSPVAEAERTLCNAP